MSTARLFAFLAVVACFTGCTVSPIKPDVQKRWKTVGIVSLMGNQVLADRISNAENAKQTKRFSTQQLGLHEIAEESVATNLHGARTRTLGNERERLFKIAMNSTAGLMFSGRPTKRGTLGKEVQRLGKTYGVDAVIVIVPLAMKLWDSDTGLYGYEIIQRSAPGNEKTAAFASQRYEVYDAETGKLAGYGEAFNNAVLPNDQWNTGSSTVVSAFSAAIRANTLEILPKIGW